MRKAGRSFCKYVENEKHALSSHFVIPCWEQLRKPYCKSSLAAVAFRVNINHSEVIQNASCTLYNMRHSLFLKISRMGWTETGLGSQGMMFHHKIFSEYLPETTEEQKCPVWLGSHTRLSLRPSFPRGWLAIKFPDPSPGPNGQFDPEWILAFMV